MTEKDTPEKESKSVSDFKEMPNADEFASLDANLQNEVLAKFDSDKDTPEQESETSPEETPKKETPKVEDETSQETKKDTPEKTQDGNWEKRYKDLQREYTKVTTKNKPKEIPSDKRSKFDHLKEANPKAKDFLNSLDEAIEEKLGERVKPLSDRLDDDVEKKNEQKFLDSTDDFLRGDLKEMKPELEAIIASEIGSTDDLVEAARKNPNLFSELKKELLDKHLDKVVEIKAKVENPKIRNKQIKDTGVSGKSKTGVVEGKEDLDLKSFRGLSSYEEMKKTLDKQGAVDESAKTRQWKS